MNDIDFFNGDILTIKEGIFYVLYLDNFNIANEFMIKNNISFRCIKYTQYLSMSFSPSIKFWTTNKIAFKTSKEGRVNHLACSFKDFIKIYEALK